MSYQTEHGICYNRRKAGFALAVFGRLFASVLMAGAFLLLSPLNARCATESWNPGGAGDGNGTWDTGVTADWNSGVTWSNNNAAIFSGTGGTVTLVNPIVNSLTFFRVRALPAPERHADIHG